MYRAGENQNTFSIFSKLKLNWIMDGLPVSDTIQISHMRILSHFIEMLLRFNQPKWMSC